MVDPTEAELIATVMLHQSLRRAGCVKLSGMDAIARSSPKLYHEMLEDAELALAALAKHRDRK